MSYLIRRVLAKTRLILDEMCRLYGKFASYLRRVLCKTRLIFPRINGPIVSQVNGSPSLTRERRKSSLTQDTQGSSARPVTLLLGTSFLHINETLPIQPVVLKAIFHVV